MENSQKIYKKQYSFQEVQTAQGKTTPKEQQKRLLAVLNNNLQIPSKWKYVIQNAKQDLELQRPLAKNFQISPFVADELHLLTDKELPKYLFHRYRYEIYPQSFILDDYPPYLQIEPSSICNYRCVFCYQTDKSFTTKQSGHMGAMTLDLYKKIVDEAEDHIEFLSLASRGEPLVCRDFTKMMEYSIGKFLNLKVNTNASMMKERHCHALLCGGAKTIVFSADAAEEPLYSRLRVNGKLNKVLKNIEQFQKIRETQYPNSKIISRVSGVLVEETQNMKAMQKLWGGLVDQISFVKYNPWENVYQSPLSNVSQPCSDLWRRMFIWFDGKVNPCDTDYKSILNVGQFGEESLSALWKNSCYTQLRANHLTSQRSKTFPCNRCVVI